MVTYRADGVPCDAHSMYRLVVHRCSSRRGRLELQPVHAGLAVLGHRMQRRQLLLQILRELLLLPHHVDWAILVGVLRHLIDDGLIAYRHAR